MGLLILDHCVGQKSLFDAAAFFVIKNKEPLIKTESWKELLETNPKIVSKIAMKQHNWKKL